MTPRAHTLIRTIVATLAPLALTACGDAGPAPATVAKAIEKAIFVSAGDCTESGKLNEEVCAELIDRAVATHVNQAPSYPSVRSCEKVEGPERCEHTGKNTFRPRLLAFLVTLSEPPTAVPLYASPSVEAGFRTANKTAVMVNDEAFIFSRLSLSNAEPPREGG